MVLVNICLIAEKEEEISKIYGSFKMKIMQEERLSAIRFEI